MLAFTAFGGHIVDLHQFSAWLSATAFSQAIQIRAWAIPAIQTVHLLSLALLFTAALMLALRVSGRGLTSEPLPALAARFSRAIWLLLLLLLATGALLIVAEPGRTITNPVFYAKMTMLAVAVAVTLWLSATAKRPAIGTSPLQVVLAVFSMMLWTGIIFAGRFIAYVESN